MESHATTDDLGTALLQRLELGQYEALVERVAKALFYRTMLERANFSRPESSHRWAGKTWDDAGLQKHGWLALARATLEGDTQ